METEILGEGEPEYCVMCLVHADELAGAEAVDRLKQKVESGELSVKKPVKILRANTRAREAGEKYIDADLNRSFPGDPESEVYEERLAARIAEELEGLKVLDLHTTASPHRFGIVLDQSSDSLHEISKTGVEKAVEFLDSSAEIPGCVRVAVEASRKSDPVDTLYGLILNYLRNSGAVEGESETAEPELFEIYESVEGSRWKFSATNFKQVEEGESFAYNGEEELRASESFYPVLMSDDGYDDIIGFKARKV
jgi:predicted deacylase